MASTEEITQEDIKDYLETQPTSQRNENTDKMAARYTPLTDEEKRIHAYADQIRKMKNIRGNDYD